MHYFTHCHPILCQTKSSFLWPVHRLTAVSACNCDQHIINVDAVIDYRDVCTYSPISLYFHFSRFKSSALSLSRIHRSHPVPPALRLIQWVEHILHSGGGTHLRPVSLTLAWYQRYLLDLALLLSLGLLVPAVLYWTFCKTNHREDKNKKIQ